jgi:hypothetical protein
MYDALEPNETEGMLGLCSNLHRPGSGLEGCEVPKGLFAEMTRRYRGM